MKMIKNEKGVAFVLTLLITAVLLTLGAVFVLRSINAWNVSYHERELTKSFYIAEGGGNSAIKKIDTLINTNMMNTINATNPSTVISNCQTYVTNGDGLAFLIKYVKNGATAQLTLNGSQAIYNQTATTLGSGTYSYTVYFAEKSNPAAVGTDQWDFPYYYYVESTGNSGGNSGKILLVGDFTVRVQRDNFAKYALFTNHQTTDDGVNVWFTDKTNFAGPLHTNERFNFALNPGGVFDGLVAQYNSSARFYNNGSPILLNANANGTTDVPTFNSGFTRGVSQITLSSSSQKSSMISQATGGNSYSSNGIYIPNSSGSLTGGIYVRGSSSISLGVDGSDNAVYTITQGSTTKTVTVNRSSNTTTVLTSGNPTPQTYTGLPDGTDDVGTIIFVRGNINSLAGTIQKDTEITIATEEIPSTSTHGDINITNHLVYENYASGSGTPGQAGYIPPSADGTDNLLGLVSWEGDVDIATNAPNNVNVHGTVLASNGVFEVDNYDDSVVGSRGIATVLGGAITDYYGAFGQFNGSTGQQSSGYGRNFVYDNRLQVGKAPPYFPSLNTFIGFTNDITDKITTQEGF